MVNKNIIYSKTLPSHDSSDGKKASDGGRNTVAGTVSIFVTMTTKVWYIFCWRGAVSGDTSMAVQVGKLWC